MKSFLCPAGAALVLALLVSSCESDGGVTARAREKSATYAALKPWEKKYIDTGSVAEGFTPDMVYISMGKPDSVDTKDLPKDTTELWTYSRYYPRGDAVARLDRTNVRSTADYQAEGATRSGRGSISNNSGVQGGSMEPADLRSYTVKVWFAGGHVAKIRAHPNS